MDQILTFLRSVWDLAMHAFPWILLGISVCLAFLLTIQHKVAFREIMHAKGGAGSPHFLTYFPKLSRKGWQTLFAGIAEGTVGHDQAVSFLANKVDLGYEMCTATARPDVGVPRGAIIKIVPLIEGCRVEPSSAEIEACESFVISQFKFREVAERKTWTQKTGRVLYFLGPLLLGETSFTFESFSETSDAATADTPIRWAAVTSAPYRSIFVSYSRKDKEVVEQLEQAYIALGDSYLRDTKVLRSGENWWQRLQAIIFGSDIFQLCWSQNASKSKNVENEWRYALELSRENFIRPIFWDEPMAMPPPELKDLHFAFFESKSM